MRWLTLVCLTACTTGLEPDIGRRVGEIDRMRQEAELLWRGQRTLEWEAWTQGRLLDLSETYRGHEKLFSKPSAERLLDEMNATTDKRRQRAARYLRRHLLWELLGFETSKAQETLESLKRSTLSMVGGQGMTVNELQTLQAKEPDAAKRLQLQQAAAQIYERLNDAHLQLDREVTETTRTLGFSSYLAFAAELRLVDLAEVGRQCEAFMADTDALFLQASKKIVVQELGLGFDSVRLADMPRLIRSPRYDQWLQEEGVLSVLGATLKPLGMALDEQPGLTLDVEKRPAKQKRARTFAVSVPEDVRVALSPSAGLASYEAALHEAGHALSFSRSRAGAFELEVLGDATVSYAYGFLLQALVGNREWQKTHLTRISGAEQAALARYLAWRRLALARRYAAKVMFEVAWHGGQPGDLALLYQNLMSRAHGFRLDEVDAKRWLVDHEPFFLSAQFLRAWFLAAQIEKKLVADHGERWFDSQQAAAALDALLARGLEPVADEVAQLVGASRVESGALLERVKLEL